MRKTLAVALLLVPLAHAQKVEITPFVGGAFGGAFPVTLTTGLPSGQGSPDITNISFPGRLNLGLAVGYRFKDHIEGEIQWTRQRIDAHGLNDNGSDQGPFARVTMNEFHGDILLHYTPPESKIRPYLLVGFGGGRLSSSDTFNGSIGGFAMGIGAGVKAYLNRRFGIRVQGRYTLTNIDNTQWCAAGGGCYTVANNIWLNQKEISVGPIFRF